ncbi:MAG: RNA polymerase sigma factor [Thiolinea sp.]
MGVLALDTVEDIGATLPLSMDDFLAEVEQRAYRIALIALSDHDEALDVVQDTMIRLVNKYQHRPSGEWRTLFFTILHNRITDSHRKNTMRHRLFGWFDRATDKEDEGSPLDRVSGQPSLQPQQQLVSANAMSELERAVHELPLRQQQAFMMRMVEGLDTKATAKVMGCSAGSVKTHLSRALTALKDKLEDHYEPA